MSMTRTGSRPTARMNRLFHFLLAERLTQLLKTRTAFLIGFQVR